MNLLPIQIWFTAVFFAITVVGPILIDEKEMLKSPRYLVGMFLYWAIAFSLTLVIDIMCFPVKN